MKKSTAMIMAAVSTVLVCSSAFAEEKPSEYTEYTIEVNDKELSTEGLPRAPYREGNTVMVPLRLISEALGYEVGWDTQTGAITVDDHYIQKAILKDGTAAVKFEGELKIIDMSREVENSVKTTVHDGCTYVPLEFFGEFLNDTVVEGEKITVSPSECEINDSKPENVSK